LNIRMAKVKGLPIPTDVVILWKRGQKTIDTKVKQLSPSVSEAVFNDRFQMKTQLEYDAILRKFARKKSNLELWRADQS
jgi:hypothetical protein